MRYSSVFLTLALTALTSFTPDRNLVVTSPSFSDNGMIPSKYSCDGGEATPPLHIENIPAGARSLAITLHDPDAPFQGGFTHWVVWDIDVTNDIPENFKGGSKGVNSIAQHQYKGICPSGTHHYEFKVYALDTKLKLDLNTDKGTLERKMRGHILAEGTLTGLYNRGAAAVGQGRVDEKMDR
jgi:Raf kinase inhibitor-like YbhB/YbcL family protein